MEGTLATLASYKKGASSFANRSVDRSFAVHLFDRFLDLVPGDRVVDLGCGPAHDAAILASKGLTAFGCDPTRPLLNEARRHSAMRGRLAQGDARSLTFRSSSIDGIWACASLLHVPKVDIALALSECFRALQPGRILFTSMQESSMQTGAITRDDDPMPERHYYFYRVEEWMNAVESAGFEIIDHRLKRTFDQVTPGATGWIETFARKPDER